VADTADAVRADLADRAIETFRATDTATVDISLVAIADIVAIAQATRHCATKARSADATETVATLGADESIGTLGARSTAVEIGLATIDQIILAECSSGHAEPSGTRQSGFAVAVEDALLAQRTLGSAAATAVQVGLIAVLHPVGANRSLALAVGADQADAIGRNPAVGVEASMGASRAGCSATAVDTGLVPVLYAVLAIEALSSLTGFRGGAAAVQADAIGVDGTGQGVCALAADVATAVDGSLGPVLHPIGASRGSAHSTGADVAVAVARELTGLLSRAQRAARATTILAGLGAVLDPVCRDAARGEALVLVRTDAAPAIPAFLAAVIGRVAGQTLGSTAVLVGLLTVEGLIVASWRLAQVAFTDSALAVVVGGAAREIGAIGDAEAATIHVGLQAVASTVIAGRHGTLECCCAFHRADGALAVGSKRTRLAILAGSARATAVQIGLQAILDLIAAARRLTLPSRADATLAVRRSRTAIVVLAFARRIGRAARATTIDLGLRAVLLPVGAGRLGAGQGPGCADPALAIASIPTGETAHTLGAVSAAVRGRLVAILHTVVAGCSHALELGADQADTVLGNFADLEVDTLVGTGAAAVHVGFLSVLDLVVAGWHLTDEVLADATDTISIFNAALPSAQVRQVPPQSASVS